MKKTTVYKKLHFAVKEMRSNVKWCFKTMNKETRILLAVFLPVSIIVLGVISMIGFSNLYKKAGEIRRKNYYKYLTYVLD